MGSVSVIDSPQGEESLCLRAEVSLLYDFGIMLLYSKRKAEPGNLHQKLCFLRLHSTEHIFELVDIYHSVSFRFEIAVEGTARKPSQS